MWNSAKRWGWKCQKHVGIKFWNSASFRLSWLGANDPGVFEGVQNSAGNFLNVFHDWWFKGPCCRCARMQRGGWTLFGPLAATGYVQLFWHGYMHLSPYHTVSYSEMITELFSEMSANSRCCIKGSNMKNHSFTPHWAPQRCTHGLSSKVSWDCYTQRRLQVQSLSKHVSFAITWCLP